MTDKIKIGSKLIAPFKVFRIEKWYLIWVLFILIFGLINIWAGLLGGNRNVFIEAINTGQLYTFSIALSAPFFVTYILGFIVARGKRLEVHFWRYKLITLLFNFVWIISIAFIWAGKAKDKTWIQIIVFIITMIFSFYMYCINEMEIHYEMLKEYDDGEYLNKEKKRMNRLESKKDKLEGKKDEEGVGY